MGCGLGFLRPNSAAATARGRRFSRSSIIKHKARRKAFTSYKTRHTAVFPHPVQGDAHWPSCAEAAPSSDACGGGSDNTGRANDALLLIGSKGRLVRVCASRAYARLDAPSLQVWDSHMCEKIIPRCPQHRRIWCGMPTCGYLLLMCAVYGLGSTRMHFDTTPTLCVCEGLFTIHLHTRTSPHRAILQVLSSFLRVCGRGGAGVLQRARGVT